MPFRLGTMKGVLAMHAAGKRLDRPFGNEFLQVPRRRNVSAETRERPACGCVSAETSEDAGDLGEGATNYRSERKSCAAALVIV